ncbi:uncharacterized protein LOC114940975 [Nylanderia fulva]|uniref:uncharacterized protein LOC114940975 n=1 Tax=Nylanderia fulva TaxID=613905 RepID=UPI0010FADABC|nr:uncharacterized protein LOC114940975 [Nylanderia fulva]
MRPVMPAAVVAAGVDGQLRQHQGVDGDGRAATKRLEGFVVLSWPMRETKRSRKAGQSSYLPVKVGSWIRGSVVRGADGDVSEVAEAAARSFFWRVRRISNIRPLFTR